MAVEKIVRMLHRQPPEGNFREQLFWLVDVIYACKTSGEPKLTQEARLVEEALGQLGEYIETGEQDALEQARDRMQKFASLVVSTVSSEKKGK